MRFNPLTPGSETFTQSSARRFYSSTGGVLGRLMCQWVKYLFYLTLSVTVKPVVCLSRNEGFLLAICSEEVEGSNFKFEV